MQCPKYDDIGTVAFDSICRTTPGFTIDSKATVLISSYFGHCINT